MGMLDRIKKRQIDGFKEFVISMETTASSSRGQIFTVGVLEDPIFMSHVMKNIKTFDDFLTLDGDEIEKVIFSQEQLMGIFAKCLFNGPETDISSLESIVPKLISRLRDEISYISALTPAEKEGAKFYLMKVCRKLQQEERIRGFAWKLPPQDIYFTKTMKDGEMEVFFENGVLASKGNYTKGKRFGFWKHFYETGSLLAEGDYSDGLKTGNWVFYYSNNKVKSMGKYKDDLKHGLWKEFDRNGKEVEVEYAEGVKKNVA